MCVFGGGVSDLSFEVGTEVLTRRSGVLGPLLCLSYVSLMSLAEVLVPRMSLLCL